MAKKQPKPKNTWQSLSNLKKSIPISFNNETIFTIEELSTQQFEQFMQSIKPEEQKTLEDVNKILNQDEYLGQVLRLMVKGISFEDMTDAELIASLNDFPTSITYQINDALEKLLVSNMVKHLHNISNTIDTIETTSKINDKFDKIAKMYDKKVN